MMMSKLWIGLILKTNVVLWWAQGVALEVQRRVTLKWWLVTLGLVLSHRCELFVEDRKVVKLLMQSPIIYSLNVLHFYVPCFIFALELLHLPLLACCVNKVAFLKRKVSRVLRVERHEAVLGI
jgi:hypothetical protein